MTRMPVTSCDKAKSELRRLHDTYGKSWRDIAKLDEYKGIAPGTLCRFAKGNWEPQGMALRERLGLPVFIPVPPCPRCHVVHLRKTCPKPRRYRDLYSLPVVVLRAMIESRTDER